MSVLYLCVALLPVILLAILHFSITGKRALKCFPSPPGLPIIGNALAFNNPDKVYETFTELSKRYGGAYTVWGFGQEALVLSSAAAFTEAFRLRGREYGARQETRRVELAGQEENIANVQPDKVWRKLTKESRQIMKMYDNSLGELEALAQRVIDDANLDINDSKGQDLDLKPIFFKATTNFMLQLMVGKMVTTNDALYEAVVETEWLMPIIYGGSVESILLEAFPPSRFLGARRLYSMVKAFESRAVHLIKLLRKEAELCAEKDITAVHVLSMLRQSVPDLSIKGVDTTLITLLLAGVSTTTNTLYPLFNLLLNNPSIYDKLQTEVNVKLGSRRMTLADRDAMPYLIATIEETLRLTSILPFLAPHATASDTQIDGKPVPAGTPVFFNAWGLHHDPEVYPEPWSFRPERFLDEQGDLLPAEHATRSNVYAFGGGVRRCTGEFVARTRLALMVPSLLQRFKFTHGKQKSSCDPRDYITGNPIQCPKYTVIPIDHSY